MTALPNWLATTTRTGPLERDRPAEQVRERVLRREERGGHRLVRRVAVRPDAGELRRERFGWTAFFNSRFGDTWNPAAFAW